MWNTLGITAPLFSFCLRIFKQLVFTNVPLRFTWFTDKEKHLFIRQRTYGYPHKLPAITVALLDPNTIRNPTPSSGKYITQGFYVRGPQPRR